MEGSAFIRTSMVAAGLATLLVNPFAAARAETSKSFQVGATIQPGCMINGQGSGNGVSLGRLDFGQDTTLSTTPHSASLSAAQSVTLRCTPGLALSMAVDAGAHAAGNVRHLQRGADVSNRIPYTLCADAACTRPIGTGQSIDVAITASNANDVKLPIFGRLTLPGTRPAGTYQDVLTVTLSW